MWLICLLSYLGLDDLPLAPIYGASFYKVHAFADVTVLEIGVELEGARGESVNFLWKNPMANYMGDLLWDLHRPKAGNRRHTQIMHINNQQFNMIYHNKSLQMWLVQLGNFYLPYVFAKFIKVVSQILLKNVLTDCEKSMLLSQN